MFQNVFSFKGRIKRLEYNLSLLIFIFGAGLIGMLDIAITSGGGGSVVAVMFIFLIPLYWFLFAQLNKRIHDIGENGWSLFIPFINILIMLYLLFAPTQKEDNEFGIYKT